MARLFFCTAMMLMLSACNDIDGKLNAYVSFMLIDEDGRRVIIPAGTHVAEFSYKTRKHEVEIEIKGIDNGKDRDFEFQLPADLRDEDFRKERLELHFPTMVGNRELDTDMLITNKILSKKGPHGHYRRCRERGSAIYLLRPIISYEVKRVTHVVARIRSGEETMALFEASKRKQGREVVWKGECGGEMPESLDDVMPDIESRCEVGADGVVPRC